MIKVDNSVRGENIRNSAKNESFPTSKDGKKKTYYFEEKYDNEHDAFIKYYDAVINNGYIDTIVNELENMGDFCDLHKHIYHNVEVDDFNYINDTLPGDERNNSILYASNLLDLEDSEEKGRKLVAKKLIPRNKVIISEYPTVLQVKPLCICAGEKLSPLYRCHNCGLAIKFFFCCDGCNVCIFCSRYCLRVAYKNYHRYECYGLQRHFWSMADTDYSYLALRMMLYGASKKFETEPESCTYGSFSNNYPFINSLETNFDNISRPVLNEILYSSMRTLLYLIAKTNFFTHISKGGCNEGLYKYIGGLLVKHHCQAQLNNILLSFPNYCLGFGVDGRWLPTLAGKAICPTIALLNHSCSPNAVVIVYADFIAVKTLKRVESGEEITICYAEVNPYLPVVERQLITVELFYFTCHCSFCKFERNFKEAPFKCPRCRRGSAKEIRSQNGAETNFGICKRCHHIFSLDEHFRNLKLAGICRRLYEKTFSIEHLTKLVEYYSKVYPKYCPVVQEIYKNLLDKHVLWGKSSSRTHSLISDMKSQKLHKIPDKSNEVWFVGVPVVLDMKNFCKIQKVNPEDYETVNSFVEEVLHLKDDLTFYLPEENLQSLLRLQVKVYAMFENLEVIDLTEDSLT